MDTKMNDIDSGCFAPRGFAQWTVATLRLVATACVFVALRDDYFLPALAILTVAMAAGPVVRLVSRRRRGQQTTAFSGLDILAGRALLVVTFYLLAAGRWLPWGVAWLFLGREIVCQFLVLRAGVGRLRSSTEAIWVLFVVTVAGWALLMPLVISLMPWPDVTRAFELWLVRIAWCVVSAGWLLLPFCVRRLE